MIELFLATLMMGAFSKADSQIPNFLLPFSRFSGTSSAKEEINKSRIKIGTKPQTVSKPAEKEQPVVVSAESPKTTTPKKKKNVIKRKEKAAVDTKLSELMDNYTLGDLIGLLQSNMAASAKDMVEQVSENLDSIYMQQLAVAQDFINGDNNVHVSSVRELMRMLLPAKYHQAIGKLKRGQSVQTIINNFGSMVNAPNAEKVEQKSV